MKKILHKYPIIGYILHAYVTYLLCSLIGFVIIFLILYTSGIYAKLERILDLKYNSPFVLVPMYGCIALSLLSAFIGVLMYLYKYKRSKNKSAFYQGFTKILEE